MVNNLRQMTLEEIKQQVQEATGNDWRVSVRLMPNGHTQVRTTRK